MSYFWRSKIILNESQINEILKLSLGDFFVYKPIGIPVFSRIPNNFYGDNRIENKGFDAVFVDNLPVQVTAG